MKGEKRGVRFVRSDGRLRQFVGYLDARPVRRKDLSMKDLKLKNVRPY